MNKANIAFISDIHSNFVALEAVLAKIDKLGITQVFCAGDVAGYHTQVNECCNELRERNIVTVMGNHDWYLGGFGFCERSKSVNDLLTYQRQIISPNNQDWLSSLPVHYSQGGIRMVHGGWSDPIDEYLSEPTEEYFRQLSGNFFISGHTHRARIEKFLEKTYCNPGSVGQPRDLDSRASFAILENSTFRIERVEYDIEKVGFLMERAGFEEYYYGGLFTGATRLQRRSAKPEAP
jgi:putative phosphoesterase